MNIKTFIDRPIFAGVISVVIVLLGATAVHAVLGPDYRITRCRGQWFEKKISNPQSERLQEFLSKVL